MANEIMRDIYSNAKEIFGQEAVGIADRLEFQVRNTLHHQILLFLGDELLESEDVIDLILCA